MPDFKEGDVVRHRVTLKKGTLWDRVPGQPNQWMIEWEDGQISNHAEVELITEEESRKYKHS